ncbi:1,6-anhydro-N-acetylmuramyl-L-alanine amidase AmpD [Seongchinamella sediminis]|uniref:1,6-anhydro-N-acetylmuramyl-L-alanine amidase AmpD n=1 Tax=Seongchinamella sediminis TaxID=2283635 RepID=A0A3L7E2I6_9GAMM|nr:1,6-anhydro-N-acetylmuramyl-L-alanine amidase AmpD [Seongchinamella sediminis]RLQ23754.1 1,6-anhydro-N-acetylmuramyl-L-alanine amidase AmpD [Seongchinamella sediminis]
MGKDNNKYRVKDGWLLAARRVPSENCELRPAGCAPDLLVIHNISLPPGQFGGDSIERFFTNCLDWEAHPFFAGIRGLRVSAHLLIRREGELLQFVSFDERAWHAGVSAFDGRDNCNDFSIGIELEGTDQLPYTDAQYQALAAVTAALFETYPQLRPERIVGHCDIAPGRKTDPGPAFDWRRYRQALPANGKEYA